PANDGFGHLAGAPSNSSSVALPTITKDGTTAAGGGSSSAVAGEPVDFTYFISPNLSPTASLAAYIVPTGNVVVLNGTVPVACTGPGDNALTSTGFLGMAEATCTTSFQYAGTYSVSAQYSGDANFTGSTASRPQPVTVTGPAPGQPTATIASPASGG